MSETIALDTRGLLCPLPVIRTQDRIKSLPSGAILEVISTDPGALHDIPAWCRVHGHTVLSTDEGAREFIVRIGVSHPASNESP